jgi:predicted ester cyclase
VQNRPVTSREEADAGRSLARRYFEDLFNAGELAVAEEILDPEISFFGPITPAGIHGIEAYKRFALEWYRGFPDRHFELVEEWVDGDRIASHFSITGTHLGEFLGQEATGNSIDVKAMNIFRIEGGKVRTIQAFFDPLHLLHPLGLAPTRNVMDLRA